MKVALSSRNLPQEALPMVHALTQLLNGHRGTGLRGCACCVSPVAAAVVASPLDGEGGLYVLRGLSHLQKLVITFPP